MGIWIARVETDRALAQLVGLGEVGFGIIRPAEKSQLAHDDGQRRYRLWILRIDRECPPEIGLRFGLVRLGVAIMARHAVLIEFVGVLAPWWPLGDALTLEFEDLRLDRAGDRVGNFVL